MATDPRIVKAEVIEMYDGGMSVESIAAETGLSKPTVYRYLGDLAVTKEPTGWDQAVASQAEILEEYKEGVSITEIASRHSTTRYCVEKLLLQEDAEGITREVRSASRETRETLIVKNYLGGARIVDIAVQFGIGQSHIYTILARHGVKPERKGASVGRANPNPNVAHNLTVVNNFNQTSDEDDNG